MSEPGKNLLMIKLPRTGSTYLSHLLASHDGIDFRHEYLNKYKDEKRRLRQGIGRIPVVRSLLGARLHARKCRDFAAHLASGDDVQYIGASLNPFKEGMSDDDIKGLINRLTKVVVLTRDNLLKQQISHLNVVAERRSGTTRPYKSYDPEKKFVSRTFVINQASIDAIADLEKSRRRFLEMVGKLPAPKLFLTYEDDINIDDKSVTLQKLADFLDLPIADAWRPEHSASDRDQHFHKIVRDDLREIIENYDDIADHPLIREYL